MSEVGLAMMEGGCKYGTHNYREDGVRASTYINGVWRHLFQQWWDQGEDIDGDSFLNHVTKAIACLVVLRDSMLLGNFIDDRPIKQKDHIPTFNEAASKLVDMFPDPVEGFTEVRKVEERLKSSLIDEVTKDKDEDFISRTERQFDKDLVPEGYGPYKPMTDFEEEIDRVLAFLFAREGNPDFMVFEPKDTARMTPTILDGINKLLSDDLSDDQDSAHIMPPGYGGKPLSNLGAVTVPPEGSPGLLDILRKLEKHNGFRGLCKGCRTIDVCQTRSYFKYKEEREGMYCSDCKHYRTTLDGSYCHEGKLLLLTNPVVGNCSLFERKRG
jgi:hypothetical protein